MKHHIVFIIRSRLTVNFFKKKHYFKPTVTVPRLKSSETTGVSKSEEDLWPQEVWNSRHLKYRHVDSPFSLIFTQLNIHMPKSIFHFSFALQKLTYNVYNYIGQIQYRNGLVSSVHRWPMSRKALTGNVCLWCEAPFRPKVHVRDLLIQISHQITQHKVKPLKITACQWRTGGLLHINESNEANIIIYRPH